MDSLTTDHDGYAVFATRHFVQDFAGLGMPPTIATPYLYSPDGTVKQIANDAMQGEVYFQPTSVHPGTHRVLLGELLINVNDNSSSPPDTIHWDDTQVVYVTFSKDGSKLFGHSKDFGFVRYSLSDKSEHVFLNVNDVSKRAFSPDGELIYLVTDEGELQVWDLRAFGEDGWGS